MDAPHSGHTTPTAQKRLVQEETAIIVVHLCVHFEIMDQTHTAANATEIAGKHCTICDVNFGPGPAPSCKPLCTLNDCNLHAVRVSGYQGACECTCLDSYTGGSCEKCAEGRGPKYPDCSAYRCSTDDCHGHGEPSCSSGKFRAGRDSYGCRCDLGFAGNRCNSCDTGYGPRYPQCERDCDVNLDCHGKAHSVSTHWAYSWFGMSQTCTCICTCLSSYTGGSCEKCAEGRGPEYPDCSAYRCSKDDCHGHGEPSCGSGKFRASRDSYDCRCDPGFAGKRCTVCDVNFGPGPPPSCKPLCTLHDCNLHAVRVSGYQGACECTCLDSYTGGSCEKCAEGRGPKYPDCSAYRCSTDDCHGRGEPSCSSGKFRASRDSYGCRCNVGFAGNRCNSCDTGYGPRYPQCERDCDNLDCHGKAHSVSTHWAYSWFGMSQTHTCICTCLSSYTGGSCEKCAEGRGPKYPDCSAYRCSKDDYHGHGEPSCGSGKFRASRDSYDCRCDPGFAGKRCTVCDVNFGPGPPPSCKPLCTLHDCNLHAVRVSGYQGACECTCLDSYTGGSCKKCAEGRGPKYPDCSAYRCSTDDCHGHGEPSCSSGKFRASRDSYGCRCDLGFAGNRGNSCDTGYGPRYSQCERDCDVNLDCHGKAHSVSTHWAYSWFGMSQTHTCICTCLSSYTGGSCEKCAEGRGPEYPDCSAYRCSKDNCHGHGEPSCDAGKFRASRDSYDCRCDPGFAGDRCHSCDTGYGPQYPKCSAACTDQQQNCSGHGRARGWQPACACTCNPGYASPACSKCEEGRGPHPDISCEYHACTSADCGVNAIAVDGYRSYGRGCFCQCKDGYGPNSETKVGCGSCLPGYGPIPNANVSVTSS